MNHKNVNLPNHGTYIIDYPSTITNIFATVSENMRPATLPHPSFFRKGIFEMFLQQLRKFPDHFSELFSVCQIIEFLRIIDFVI